MELTKDNVPKEVEQKILHAIALKKELEQYEKEIKDQLLEAMQDNNIVSIKNDNFTITLASRSSYKAFGEIPKDFAKIMLDTTKVSSHEKLYGELPNGIHKSETKYITWRAK
jgi:hypothetical protein